MPATTWKAVEADVNAICSLPLLSVTVLALMLACADSMADGVPALPAAWMAAFSLSVTVLVVSEVVRSTEIWVAEKPGPESWNVAVAVPAELALTIFAMLVFEATARLVPGRFGREFGSSQPQALESTTELARSSVTVPLAGVSIAARRGSATNVNAHALGEVSARGKTDALRLAVDFADQSLIFLVQHFAVPGKCADEDCVASVFSRSNILPMLFIRHP